MPDFESTLNAIESTVPWRKRMAALGLVLKSHLFDLFLGRTSVELSLLERAVTIASADLTKVVHESPTVQAITLERSALGDVVDSIVSIVFVSVSKQQGQSASEVRCAFDDQESRWFELLHRLSKLLQAGGQWMTRLAADRMLADRYANLPEHERAEWERRRDAFASQMSRVHFDVSFRSDLNEPESAVRQCLDRVRYFGTLAQANRNGKAEMCTEVDDTIREGDAVVFHCTAIRSSPSPVFGVIVATARCIVLLSSAEWSTWVTEFLGETYERRLEQLQRMPSFSEISQLKSLGITSLFINDLTRFNVPLEAALDPDSHCITVLSPVPCVQDEPLRRTLRVQFWGSFEYGRRPAIEVDDDRREIRALARSSAQENYRFPVIPSPLRPIAGAPRPLPLSHYERWELASLTQATSASLRSLWGRVSRESFLAEDWRCCDVLHIATHGMAINELPEGSHLVFGNVSGLPECVTLSDILSVDWSQLTLVFLNCCVTNVGPHNYGDERMSLAWAFLAGGAKAVIGHRWEVLDEAAYLFAKRFYAALLLEGATVRVAFHLARRFLQVTPSCSDKSVWGTFVLLENPW